MTNAAWRAANRDHMRAIQAAWEAAHPESARERKERRRAKKAGVLMVMRVVGATDCYLCDLPLVGATHWDHEPALVHEPMWCELRLTHAACNLAKGATPAAQYRRRRTGQ